MPRIVDNSPARVPGARTQVPVEIMRRVIAPCSRPGDMVVDFFNGFASTGAAAGALGRRYVGYEIRPQVAEVGRKRLLMEQATHYEATRKEFARAEAFNERYLRAFAAAEGDGADGERKAS